MNQALLNRHRSSEVLFRAQGFFDAAIASQRQADYIESGGEPGRCPYSYLDRGIGGKLEFQVSDGWLRIFSADGAITLCFTLDRAAALWMLLMAHLEITPDELRNLADSLEAQGPLSLDDVPSENDPRDDVRIFVPEDGTVYRRDWDDYSRWRVFVRASSREEALGRCARECWLGVALASGRVVWMRMHEGPIPDASPFFEWHVKYKAWCALPMGEGDDQCP